MVANNCQASERTHDPASLFGDLTFDSYDCHLTSDRLPSNANPWTKQTASDLSVLSVMHTQFAQVSQSGLLSLFAETGTLRKEFGSTDMNELRAQFLSYSISAERWMETELLNPTPPTELYGSNCEMIECPIADCSETFKNLRALASHMRRSNDTGHESKTLS